MVDAREVTRSALRSAGVPDPDGSALGDARHVLAILRAKSDDFVVLTGTVNVYGDPGSVTGLSLGDLRELVRLAAIGQEVENVVRKLS